MVWSKHDFEREIRRQLIELTSIRKRVSEGQEDLLERIDRLEVSQRYLIRKLDEFFDAENTPKERAENGLTEIEEFEAAVAEEATVEIPESLAHEIQSLLAECSRREVADYSEATQKCEVVVVAETVVKVPDLNERCAACGKMLVSSMLAGGEVTEHESSWYHSGCLDAGCEHEESSVLN